MGWHQLTPKPVCIFSFLLGTNPSGCVTVRKLLTVVVFVSRVQGIDESRNYMQNIGQRTQVKTRISVHCQLEIERVRKTASPKRLRLVINDAQVRAEKNQVQLRLIVWRNWYGHQ
jgi:hypothetical protein